MRLPTLRLFVGGAWRDPSSGRTVATEEPATGGILCELPDASAADVDAAVRAARDALPVWRATPPRRRAELLGELARLVRDASDEIAALEARDVGMPLAIAKRLGAAAMRRNLEYHAGWAERLYGDVVPVDDKTFDYTRREPLGVVGAVIPWNTPALLCGGKAGPALACGNTIVLKPSPWGSLTTLRFAELAAEAGIPPGVVNVVTGGAEAGRALVGHRGVDALTFTGSTRTGREVIAAAAARVKNVHLELGGKSPNVVFADADLERASVGVALGCFGLTGQACAAGTRLLVEEGIADDFVKMVIQATGFFRAGDPLDPATTLGPLVSRPHLERVLDWIETGRGEATLLRGGERLGADSVGARLGAGNFVAPAIFTGCTNDMRICREEIFGPVLSVLTFRDDDEAVAIANDSEYGLAAGVWTRDLARAHTVAARLEAGTVWVNAYGNLPNAAPFGGYKQSGIGREGGREAIGEYTQVKNVFVGLE